MRIFQRAILVTAITTTAIFVWGKNNLFTGGGAEHEESRQVTTANQRQDASRRLQDSIPASGQRTLAMLALNVAQVVNKTSAKAGDTLTYTFTIDNYTGDTAKNVVFTDQLDGNTTAVADSLWYSPIALDDKYQSLGNVGITVPAASGVLVNDQTGLPAGNLKTFSRLTSKGGTVTLHADGSFDYVPAAGFTGTDTVQYLLENRLRTDMGVIHIEVANAIWFINNTSTAPTEDGRLETPFKTLAAFQAKNNGTGLNPKAGHTIFIHESNTPYTAPVTLLTGQKLLGQDATTDLPAAAGFSLPAFSKSLPAFNNGNALSTRLTSSANVINLTNGGSNYLVRGLTIGNKTGSGISGVSFGTLAIGELSISGTGQAMSLNTGTLAIAGGLTEQLETLSSTSGVNGVSLTNVNGSLIVRSAASALTGSTGSAFFVSGGTATITYPGSINGPAPVTVQNTTGSNLTFSGNLTATSTGLSLTGNTGSTITFSGAAKTLSTGANTAVNLTNNGGSTVQFTNGGLAITTNSGDGLKSSGAAAALTVTGANNTILVNGASPNSGGTAVNISGTTIGAAGLNFRAITTTNTQKAIYLANTGSAGGLTVTGVGTTAASGGTIMNCSGPGIEIINAHHLKLANLKMINVNQNSAAQGGFLATDLQGTSELTNCSFTDANVRNAYLIQSVGTLTLRVKDADFAFSTATTEGDLRQDCFEMRTKNAATATVIISGSQFKRAGTKGLQLFAENSSTMNASIANCTIDRMGGQMAGLEVGSSQFAKMNAWVDGNPTINATNEIALNVYAGGESTSRTEAVIRNNGSLAGAGDVNSFSDPVVQVFSNGQAKNVSLLQNNTIGNPDGQAILTRATEGAGTVDAKIIGNNITIPANGFDGIEVRSGADLTPYTNRNCSYVLANTVVNNSAQGGHSFFVQPATPGTTVQLQQTAGPNAADPTALWTSNGNTGTNIDFYAETGANLQIGTQYVCVTPANLAAPTFAPKTELLEASLPPVANNGVTPAASPVGSLPQSVTKANGNTAAAATLSGGTVSLSGFTLPTDKRWIVQFMARVNDDFPVNTCTVTNEAEVDATGFSTARSNKATININAAPVITTCQPAITATVGTCTSTQSFAITATGCPAPTYTYTIVATGQAITSPYAFPVGTTTVKAKASNLAGADSCTFTVTITGTEATWTGTTSTDWNTAANWSCNVVPDVNTNVTINNGPVNMPVLSGNGAAKNINLETGATLTIQSGVTFEVAGDFTSGGTVTANGTVHYSGVGDQAIAPASYNNLTVSGGGTKTLTGATAINGLLQFQNSFIGTGSQVLTLGAANTINGAGATAFIITTGGGQVKKLGLGSGGNTDVTVIPVGTSSTSYTPASISNSGTLDNFTLQLLDNVYSAYSGTTPSGAMISSGVVKKTWFVSEETAGGSMVTLTLQWNAADQLPGFVPTMSYVAHNTGMAWLAGPTASADAGSEPGSYVRSWAGLTSFSPFGVGSSGSALPVRLVSFKGYQNGSANQLQWVTANEQVQAFDVERSDKQTGFARIGTVAAGSRSYTWDDLAPLKGDNFYRLRILHNDGSVTYSGVVKIHRQAGTPSLHVYPTPVTDGKLNLQLQDLEKGRYAVRIYSASGQLVYTATINHEGGSSLQPVQLPPAISQGIFHLQVQKGELTINQTIVVQ